MKTGTIWKAGLLFYYILNGKDDDFLEEHDFSREEIMTGIQDLADRYGLSGIAEAFPGVVPGPKIKKSPLRVVYAPGRRIHSI